MDFFHNEFAGRVATKVMQTALARARCGDEDSPRSCSTSPSTSSARWCCLQRATGGLPAAGAVARAATSPRCWYFVPKLGSCPKQQADARSLVTGRIVDSYTNIPTVKTVRPRRPRGRLCQGGHGAGCSTPCTVRCAVSTELNIVLQRAQRPAAVLGDRRMAIWLWQHRRDHHRRHRLLCRLCSCACRACRTGSCGRWPGCSRTSASSRTAWKPSPATAP